MLLGAPCAPEASVGSTVLIPVQGRKAISEQPCVQLPSSGLGSVSLPLSTSSLLNLQPFCRSSSACETSYASLACFCSLHPL